MEITVNHQTYTLTENVSVAHLLSAVLRVPAHGIAVAVNQAVVCKPDWHNHHLQAGDRVMLIKATQGG